MDRKVTILAVITTIVIILAGAMFFINVNVKVSGNWNNYSLNIEKGQIRDAPINKLLEEPEKKLLTELANPRLQIRNSAGTEVIGLDHLGSGIFTGNISATTGATFGGNVNMSNKNITTINYIKFNKVTGACDLTLNGSICSNTTGTYIVG
jgi:hypothetical protein